jgi:cytochrome c2
MDYRVAASADARLGLGASSFHHSRPPAPSQPQLADQNRETTATPVGSSSGSTGLISGDAVAGKQVFKKCEACHSLEPGKNLIGPSLAGVVGRRAGSEPGYDYSQAMKESDLTWNAETISPIPRRWFRETRCHFLGLKTDRDRADIIALLSQGWR